MKSERNRVSKYVLVYLIIWPVIYLQVLVFSFFVGHFFLFLSWELIQTAILVFGFWITQGKLAESIWPWFIVGKLLFIDLSYISLWVLGLDAKYDQFLFPYSVVGFLWWYTIFLVFSFRQACPITKSQVEINLTGDLVNVTFLSIGIGAFLLLSWIYVGSPFGFLSQNYGERNQNVNGHFLYPLIYLLMGCSTAIGYKLASRCPGAVSRWFWFSALIFIWFLFFLKGSRGWVLVTTLAFLLAYVDGRKQAISQNTSRLTIASIALIFFGLALFMSLNRGGAAGSGSISLAQTLSLLLFSGGLDGVKVGLQIVYGLAHDIVDYQYGLSYWSTLVNPIPRALWESKPSAFSAEVMPFIDPFGNANRAPTIFIEAFANFSYLGPIALAMIFGLYLSKLINSTSALGRAVFIHSMPFLILQVRGDFLSMTIPYFISVFSLALIILSSKSFR